MRAAPASAALLLAFTLLVTSGAQSNADCTPSTRTGDARPQVVIIIDDIGHRFDTGRAAAKLPGRITLAVLPDAPHAQTLAWLGEARGKEIMLHAPMASQRDTGYEEPETLTDSLAEQEFTALLLKQVASVPGVRGVNNHMGSELTRQQEPMDWLMKVLAARKLYFVDSRTTADTVATTAAEQAGVPHLSRSVFLDNDTDTAAIAARFEETLAVAKRNGYAIAIGHPHPQTLEYLSKTLPELRDRGYRLSWPSEILRAESEALTTSGAVGEAEHACYSRTSMPRAAM